MCRSLNPAHPFAQDERYFRLRHRLMKRSAVLTIGACAAGIWVAALLTVARAAPQAGPTVTVSFQTQIQPILATHCLECHSQDRRKGGLSLATYEDILEGGRNGAVLRPSNGAGSAIVHRLSGATDDPQMPKDEDPLKPEQIALIRAWPGGRAQAARPTGPRRAETPGFRARLDRSTPGSTRSAQV